MPRALLQFPSQQVKPFDAVRCLVETVEVNRFGQERLLKIPFTPTSVAFDHLRMSQHSAFVGERARYRGRTLDRAGAESIANRALNRFQLFRPTIRNRAAPRPR